MSFQKKTHTPPRHHSSVVCYYNSKTTRTTEDKVSNNEVAAMQLVAKRLTQMTIEYHLDNEVHHRCSSLHNVNGRQTYIIRW